MTQEIEERCIPVEELRLGMFVCRLDRPWEGTPFPLQGVEVLDEGDIRALTELCDTVYIDARREISDGPALTLTRTRLFDSRFDNVVNYGEGAAVVEELPRAQKSLETASLMVERIFADIADGRELSAEHVEQAVRPMVASVLRSPDAFFWVEGLRSHDSYSYKHAISCSALAAAFGRHMGFVEETIISLAAGGLLMDVGKTQVAEAILQFPGPLSMAEEQQAREHVRFGMEIVAASSITDPDVLDIVATHHERYDGSGYPHGLMGTAVPLTGRMLGIIDSYDAMVSLRPYRAPISRHAAIRQIYAARDSLFQAELVEQFQVCLGVFPTGSLVELSNGEVAVVMAQNKVRRLRPKVIIVGDRDKQPLDEFRNVDLLQQETKVDIVRTLSPGTYGFDTAELFLQ